MTETATKPAKMNAYASNVTLSIGMLSTLGTLYTVAVTNAGKEEEFHLVCPDCTTPGEFLRQRYACTENPKHGPFVPDETKSGRLEDGKMVVLDRETVQEARSSIMPDKELDLQVHLRSEVEGHTWAKGNLYVFQPSGKSPLYGILKDVLRKRPEIVLLAKTSLRHHDKVVLVEFEGDQLVVREMLFPEDSREFAAVETDRSSPKLIAQAEMLIDASLEKFDPDEYKKDSRARIKAVVEEAAGQAPKKGAKKAAVKKLEETDLSELIAQSIAMRKKAS